MGRCVDPEPVSRVRKEKSDITLNFLFSNKKTTIMLPLLALPTSGPAKRRKTDAIFFKAFKNGEFRKLSNLFGPVEWKFQLEKFRVGSGVREWMEEHAYRQWTAPEFEAELKLLDSTTKAKSYISADGEPAAGIMPKLISLIVRNPSSLDARKRLAYVLKLPRVMTPSEASAWVATNVLPEIPNEAKDALMLNLLREKFKIPKYRQLLLSTGNSALHEAARGGNPNRYEFHPLSDERSLENAALEAAGLALKWSEGGDVLGKLMTMVREELKEGEITE